MTDRRRYAPATARNRDPILAVLREVLSSRGRLLEIASGSGEHAVHFARSLPRLVVQPTDPAPEAIDSIEAWRQAEPLPNLRPALLLDAQDWPWPVGTADALACINMVHISPWAATEGLMRGAATVLPQGAPLYLYGPYLRDGVPTAASNLAFDADLKARDPRWGLRRLEDVAALARDAGFSGPAVTEMPANNLSLVFRRV